MPFEPLGTDEKLDAPVKREKDVDAVMLAGCMGFVITSIGSYLLSAWPFFAMPDLRSIEGLTRTCFLGFGPTAIAGAVASRRFGLPGATGFFAGAMAMAIFLVLRLQQVFLLGQTRDDLMPEYPSFLAYIAALGWLICSALIGLVSLPKRELS